ncbi:hypothetical protein QR680_001201 [Steinernema hermaphroditum]|uniref:MULE transposase domain-containing protein n=1 Tax=Steinernema hermaphroditum TaxID=289476 RepID=A0AA39GY33_9BILA|nr:hypothetical protein QR680_001201 [Steinernema hermaphroditum]
MYYLSSVFPRIYRPRDLLSPGSIVPGICCPVGIYCPRDLLSRDLLSRGSIVTQPNAAKQVFRNSTVKSCYFHFSKNVMDKVATLGLKAIYDRSTNASFCTWIRTFIGSAQAPNSYWHLILDYLRENMPQSYEPAENAKIRQLFQYFNDYWARYRNS